MLGTSLHDVFAPLHGNKQSDAVKNARVQGAPHAKKKRRLNVPDERRGRGGGGEAQLQLTIVAGHLHG